MSFASFGGYLPYNILPVEDRLSNHAALQFSEVQCALFAIHQINGLDWKTHGRDRSDVFDWLRGVFGFQYGNVRNQREHLILLLSNTQMRLDSTSTEKSPSLHDESIHKIFNKITKNYSTYCEYLGKKNNMDLSLKLGPPAMKILYTSLFLLIWGEAANVRFMPECLCYIFHHMADDMNKRILYPPSHSSDPPNEYSFLNRIVTPLYNILSAEANAGGGKIPHNSWRNYDDINEFFWSKKCFQEIGWPIKVNGNFFVPPSEKTYSVRKVNFIEQRSFLNVFQSFQRMWTFYIIMLQAMAIIAWEVDDGTPWSIIKNKNSYVKLLTCFMTWAFLRTLSSVIDIVLEGKLIFQEFLSFGLRVILKLIISALFTFIFILQYIRMWNEVNSNSNSWNSSANQILKTYLVAIIVFLVPQIISVLFFLFPWLGRFIETSNWGIMHFLTWWLQPRIYVGRGMHESTWDGFKYSLFWILLLSTKFSFSYYFQVKTLVNPTNVILELTDIQYKWFNIFTNNNYMALFCVWSPVFLVYIMDTQIWYAIFSSIFGYLVGLFQHIGEIHDVRFLFERFQSLPRAVQFNLFPQKTEITKHKRLAGFWNGLIHRWELFKVRYARMLGKKSSNAEPIFGPLWNSFIDSLREEDLLSNREQELLKVPASYWDISVPLWPSILLSNELQMSLKLAQGWSGSNESLWRRISSREYARCAVLESYQSLKYLLRGIVTREQELNMIDGIFEILDACAKSASSKKKTEFHFLETFNVSALPDVHAKLVAFVAEVMKKPKPDDLSKVIRSLQALHFTVVTDFVKSKTRSILEQSEVLQSKEKKILFVDALQLPPDAAFYRQVKRLHTTLSTSLPSHSIPVNLSARRRITFFCNSMFMDMPSAPSIDQMRAFCVMTPYYSEIVNYTKKEVKEENEDGISTIYYLQKIYPDEWKNFLERMGKNEDQLWATEDGKDILLWASYRGQTLSRTVRGMMYYRKALEILGQLDSSSPLTEGFKDLAAMTADPNPETPDSKSQSNGFPHHSPSVSQEFSQVLKMRQTSRHSSFSSSPSRPPLTQGSFSQTTSPTLRQKSQLKSKSIKFRRGINQIRALADIKFTYVVTCQIYGKQKKNNEPAAGFIFELMQRFEALRIAYVDEVPRKDPQNPGMDYFSVLIKCNPISGKEEEIFRIKLPGHMKLGEGKPENQNHAIVFSRGDALQTIDMNQDNYIEEAFKVRNLLQEFNSYNGARKPTILGIREHVFTGSVSSLAGFMSAQETAFVTLGQRVLADPLKIRMHYGHPDIFDRLWFITRGGISKSSRTINISEDIFAGFNCTLRGGSISHHEYIQVGKGRDVGLNQIALFEAKVASGNGEQILSRDVHRLGNKLDFFRMLSFYYTSVGFYISTMITVLTLYAFLWGRCYLALSGYESSLNSSDYSDSALTAALNQQFLVQVGMFTAIPMLVEAILEHGVVSALSQFFLMQLQLSSIFFTFSLGTKTHYFGRTVLHGGAKYRATGRGFVVRHEKFTANYRLFSRSHFVKGLELGTLTLIYMIYSDINRGISGALITISAWFLIASWTLAPFIFNPSGFDWLKTVEDWKDWFSWLYHRGGVLVKEDQSWEVWWREENDHLKLTGTWGLIAECVLDLRYFLFQYGIVYQLDIVGSRTSILVYALSWSYVVVAIFLYAIISLARSRYSLKHHFEYRLIIVFIASAVVAILCVLLTFTSFGFGDFIISFLAFLPTGWGILQLLQVARVLFPSLDKAMVWPVVLEVSRFYEFILGVLVGFPVAVLAWLPGLQDMQTRILFNQAFSRGLQISRILVGKNPNAGY